MTADTARTAIASCSFCLKPNTEIAKLVAGPGVYICNECVDLCVQVIEGEKNKPAVPVPQVAPWERVDTADQVLAHLPLIAATHAHVEQNLTGWVRRGRALGVTWAQIGQALGMTRQSAWERFSGEE
jgi:ATP-dependent protease Clp ATPase subunit